MSCGLQFRTLPLKNILIDFRARLFVTDHENIANIENIPVFRQFQKSFGSEAEYDANSTLSLLEWEKLFFTDQKTVGQTIA